MEAPEQQHHSAPIPISGGGAPHDHHRRRSSVSSMSSTDSPPHTPPQQTTAPASAPRVLTSTSPSSPILSYLLSPTKSPTGTAFPGFKRFGGPIMEDDEDEDAAPVQKHIRRQSMVGRFPSQTLPRVSQPTGPPPPAAAERGAGLLRRLSLGSAFARPQVSVQPVSAQGRHEPTGAAPPPNSAVSPQPGAHTIPRVKARRATTTDAAGLGAPASASPPHRAPSPMGERILKGHFDGFV